MSNWVHKLPIFVATTIATITLSFAPGIGEIAAAPAQAAKCGGLGQPSCGVWTLKPACERGLEAKHPFLGTCVKSRSSVMSDTRAIISRNNALMANLASTWAGCFSPQQLLGAASNRDTFFKAIADSKCLADVLRIAKDAGYGHVTVGSSASLGLVLGGDVETGFAFDVDGRRAPVFYQTKGITFGSVGGGGSVVFGLGKGPATVANLQGTEHGGSVGFAAVGGGGATASYSYSGQLQSIGVVVTTGGKFEIAYNRTSTDAKSTGRKAPAPALASSGGGQADGYGDEPPIAYAPSDRPTKLRLCNETPYEVIYAGVGYYDDGTNMPAAGWSAKGWKKLKRGRCQTTTIPNDGDGYAYEGSLFVFASSEAGWYGKGETAMCVTTPESNIPLRQPNADEGCPYPSEDFYDTATYEWDYVAPTSRNTFTFYGEPDVRSVSRAGTERVAPKEIEPLFYSGKICNQTSADVIYVGYGIEDPGRTYAHGWFPVRKGQCHVEDLGEGKQAPFGSYVWAYATDGTSYWGGNDKRFCLRTPETARRTSDTQSARCGGPGQFRMYTQMMGNLEEQRHLEHVFTGKPTGRIEPVGSGN